MPLSQEGHNARSGRCPRRARYGPHGPTPPRSEDPLTTIYARAQFLARAIRRSPSLTDEERGRMLAGITAIETAVREHGAVIDAHGR